MASSNHRQHAEHGHTVISAATGAALKLAAIILAAAARTDRPLMSQSQRSMPTKLLDLYFAHSTSLLIKWTTTAVAALWVAVNTGHRL